LNGQGNRNPHREIDGQGEASSRRAGKSLDPIRSVWVAGPSRREKAVTDFR
jgi:hypothetical protein